MTLDRRICRDLAEKLKFEERPKGCKEVNTRKPGSILTGKALCSWRKRVPGITEAELLGIVSNPNTHSKIKTDHFVVKFKINVLPF